MIDKQIDELLRGHVRVDDPEARDRARYRLRRFMANQESQPVRPRRRLLPLLAGASVVGVVLLTLATLLPPGPGGPSLSAAEEIRELGRASIQQAVLRAGPGEFLYRRSVEQRREGGGSTRNEYDVALRVAVESWIANDGSGVRVTTIEEVEFVSPLDRENWVENGSPPIREAGDVHEDQFGPGELPVYSVEHLPADPAALRRILEGDTVIIPAPGDVNLLSTIGTLMSQQDLPSDVRQALFEIAATIPGINVEHDVRDQLGRPAVAIVASDTTGDTTLYFDLQGAVFLGQSVDYPAADGHPEFTDWRLYVGGGIVSEPGEQP